jgi:pyruvate dehydrogenase E2 component (dihydrolipoyllysine-residue acetyltransferase)
MPEFRMPSLGADMDAGTIIEWLVKPGDEVHRGDIVAVVDTDKADVDVEIFADGVVDEILVPPGEKVDVGTPLATIAAPGETGAKRAPAAKKPPRAKKAAKAPRAKAPKAKAPSKQAPKRAPRRRPAAKTTPETRPPAAEPAHSPVVRRLARHLGVDLAGVAGTGPGGAVTRADVERAATGTVAAPQVSWAAPSTAEATADVVEAPDRSDAMRRSIAALMARSKREIPHYYLGTHVDATPALDWLERTNLERPVPERLLPAALFLKAVALAAREVPQLNGFWLDDTFRPGDGVHLGVAISLRQAGGLIAPAIHDADRKDLTTLMSELRDLVNRTRAGRLRSSEMSDPTLTVTNLGDQGVETVYGVIYPPQVALVGVGKIAERPWAAGNMVGVRRVTTLTLAGDHRASDGHTGAQLLAAVDRFLQEPETL